MIAKVVSGSSFGETLDYLLNPKKEQQERVEKDIQEREQERQRGGEQGRPEEVERTPPTESKTREETGRRDDKNLDAPRGREGWEKQPRTEAPERHFEQARDLPNEFEPGQRHRVIGGNVSGKTPRELEREFGLVEELRPGVKKAGASCLHQRGRERPPDGAAVAGNCRPLRRENGLPELPAPGRPAPVVAEGSHSHPRLAGGLRRAGRQRVGEQTAR